MKEYDDDVSQGLYRLRDWVYTNYHTAYILGTGILLFHMFYPRLFLFLGLWGAAIGLGFFLEPCVEPTNVLYGGGLVKGSPSQGMTVALTFDDGPGPDTPAVLDALQELGIKATFFCIGEQVEEYPETVRRIQAEGHLLGNHTYSHRNLMLANSIDAQSEISRAQEAFVAAGVERPAYFRHPFGYRAPWTQFHVKAASVKPVFWSLNPRDFQNPGAKTICARVVAAIHPGAIVLLHDGREHRGQTVEALRRLVPKLREQGYEFVRVDQLQPA